MKNTEDQEDMVGTKFIKTDDKSVSLALKPQLLYFLSIFLHFKTYKICLHFDQFFQYFKITFLKINQDGKTDNCQDQYGKTDNCNKRMAKRIMVRNSEPKKQTNWWVLLLKPRLVWVLLLFKHTLFSMRMVASIISVVIALRLMLRLLWFSWNHNFLAVNWWLTITVGD